MPAFSQILAIAAGSNRVFIASGQLDPVRQVRRSWSRHIRHIYNLDALGDFFEFHISKSRINETWLTVSKTTDVTPPSATKPYTLNGSFLGLFGSGDVILSWVNHGGVWPFTIQRKTGAGGSVSTLTTAHAAPLTGYTDEGIVQLTGSFWLYYRLKDNLVGSGEVAYTPWKGVLIPGYDPRGGGAS